MVVKMVDPQLKGYGDMESGKDVLGRGGSVVVRVVVRIVLRTDERMVLILWVLPTDELMDIAIVVLEVVAIEK